MKMGTSRSVLAVLSLAVSLSACNQAMISYKKGVHYFDAGEYNLSLPQFEKAAKGDIDPKRLNYYTAEAYRLSNRLAESAPFYQKAIDAGTIEPDVRMYYAYALKARGNYADALNQLQQYVAANPVSKVNLEKAQRELGTLRAVDAIVARKTELVLRNMSLNTPGSEFAPVVQDDELIFTASRKDLTYKNNGLPMLGLYKVKLNQKPDETGSSAQLFSNNIFQNDVNEGTPAFSKDGKTMVFARGNNGKRKGGIDVDLYISRKNGDAWGTPQRLPISDSTAWDGSPAFSADGKVLYFASNRANSVGGIDLYRVNMDNSGRFGRPVNMGRDINTPGDEMFPFVASDGKLYFASDGHPGLGKLDVFVATRSQGIIRVENMGQPINSPADDFGYVLMEPGKGFLVSNRTGGKGDDDLYFFDTTTPTDPTIAQRDPKDPNNPNNPNDPNNPNNPNRPGAPKMVRYFLAGTVSANEQPPIPLDSVKVRIVEESSEEVIAEVKTGKPGTWGKYPLKEGKEYSIVAERKGYLTRREPFNMQGRSIPEIFLKKSETDTTFTVNILLDQLEVNKTFVLDNIYYDLNKFNIRSDAAQELDKLVTILKDNPTLRIELSSHTDARDTDSYNLKLSQNRARSAVEYVVSKGVDADRMTAKGYGETQLIVKNAKTEEEHQRNRRTEFKILDY